MTQVRAVLYAEGLRETGRAAAHVPPLDPLPPDVLGPVHRLLGRLLGQVWNLPGAAVQWLSPLRLRTGKLPRGSDLLKPARLGPLLHYPSAERAPAVTIVLVDADGQAKPRRKELDGLVAAEQPIVPVVCGVAVQEVEAWWLADPHALGRVTGSSVTQPPSPEGMKRGEAKQRLYQMLARGGPEEAAALLLRLADAVDLGTLRRSCPSFDRLGKDLAACAPP